METLGVMVKPTTTRPEWGPAKIATAIFGISRTQLYRLAADGSIKSASLRKRGEVKGKRLFSLDSIAAFIEKQAESEVSTLSESLVRKGGAH